MRLAVVDDLPFGELSGQRIEAQLETVNGLDLHIILRLFQSQPQAGPPSAEALKDDVQ